MLRAAMQHCVSVACALRPQAAGRSATRAHAVQYRTLGLAARRVSLAPTSLAARRASRGGAAACSARSLRSGAAAASSDIIDAEATVIDTRVPVTVITGFLGCVTCEAERSVVACSAA